MSIHSSLRGFAQRSLLLSFFLSAIPAAALAADASQDLWQNTRATPLPADAPAVSIYRPLRLDVARMNARLATARHSASAITLALPRPDGGYAEFLLADSHTMPDALQNKFPSIVSLAGSDADGRRARVDISPLGFQAMVFDRGRDLGRAARVVWHGRSLSQLPSRRSRRDRLFFPLRCACRSVRSGRQESRCADRSR